MKYFFKFNWLKPYQNWPALSALTFVDVMINFGWDRGYWLSLWFLALFTLGQIQVKWNASIHDLSSINLEKLEETTKIKFGVEKTGQYWDYKWFEPPLLHVDFEEGYYMEVGYLS